MLLSSSSFSKCAQIKRFRTKQFCINNRRYSFKCSVPQQSKSTPIIVKNDLLKYRTCFISNCEQSEKSNLPTQVAIALANYGANVIVHGKEKHYIEHVKSLLPIHETSQTHGFVYGDLDDFKNSVDVMTQVGELTEKLDVLVHNAGVINSPQYVKPTEFDLHEFDKLVRHNLTTPFALVKRFLPLIEKGSNPSIIFSSTEVLTDPTEKHYQTNNNTEVSYYISKFGFRSSAMLTKMLAHELEQKKIRVNSIDPGRVFQFSVPEVIPEGSDRTVAYVWLARADTQLTAAQLDVKDWIRRDPKLYNYYY